MHFIHLSFTLHFPKNDNTFRERHFESIEAVREFAKGAFKYFLKKIVLHRSIFHLSVQSVYVLFVYILKIHT